MSINDVKHLQMKLRQLNATLDTAIDNCTATTESALPYSLSTSNVHSNTEGCENRNHRSCEQQLQQDTRVVLKIYKMTMKSRSVSTTTCSQQLSPSEFVQLPTHERKRKVIYLDKENVNLEVKRAGQKPIKVYRKQKTDQQQNDTTIESVTAASETTMHTETTSSRQSNTSMNAELEVIRIIEKLKNIQAAKKQAGVNSLLSNRFEEVMQEKLRAVQKALLLHHQHHHNPDSHALSISRQ